MPAPACVIRYYRHENTATFRVAGRATMTQSLPLRRRAEELIGNGVTRLRVDLRACDYMDSTFLGTLLTLKKTLDKGGGQLALVLPSAACNRILQQMGLLGVLTAETEDSDASARWLDLPCEAPDQASFKRNVVQAHEELASLPGPAGEQFKQVMRCLANEPSPPPGKRPPE